MNQLTLDSGDSPPDLCLLARPDPVLDTIASACRAAGCMVVSTAELARVSAQPHVAIAWALQSARTIAIAVDEDAAQGPLGALARRLLRDACEAPGRQVVLLTERGRSPASEALRQAISLPVHDWADVDALIRSLVMVIGLQLTLPLYADVMRDEAQIMSGELRRRARPVLRGAREPLSLRRGRALSGRRAGTAREGRPQRPPRAAR